MNKAIFLIMLDKFISSGEDKGRARRAQHDQFFI